MQNDIEIYLYRAQAEQVEAWLTERFGPLASNPWKSLPKNAWGALAHYQGQALPIMLVAHAAGAYSSLWINSRTTPWASDLECAQEAHNALGTEARCATGSWQEDKESELWYSLRDGQLSIITWPG